MELPKETIERIEKEASKWIVGQGNNTIGLNAYPANLGYKAVATSEALRNEEEIKRLREALKRFLSTECNLIETVMHAQELLSQPSQNKEVKE